MPSSEIPEDHEKPDMPPMSPAAEETPAVDAQGFVSECLELSKKMEHSLGPFTLARQVITQSERWGTVWRADYEGRWPSDPFVNRLVIWRQPNGTPAIIVGQDDRPL